jgi:hypothetical protein
MKSTRYLNFLNTKWVDDLFTTLGKRKDILYKKTVKVFLTKDLKADKRFKSTKKLMNDKPFGYILKGDVVVQNETIQD